MQESYWDIIYETHNAIEAKTVKSLLETNGVDVVLKCDESLQNTGVSKFTSNYQLWIPGSNLGNALRILEMTQ